MLKERLLSSVVFAPAVGLAFYYGGWTFVGLLTVVTFMAAHEYRRLIGLVEVDVGAVFVVVSGLAAPAGFFLDGTLFVPALVAGALILLSRATIKTQPKAALYGLAGFMYLGGLFGVLALLRGGAHGKTWALLALFGTWATDVGAYLGGSVLGKRKLAPRISPAKSVEGALSGILMAALVSGLLAGFLGLPPLVVLVAGSFLSVLGQMGDLLESLLKRFCGVKDSGHVIPGHGGVLDRFDSLLFTGAGAYLLRILYGAFFR